MEVQSQSSDRINTLPEGIFEKILTHMPIQDALRTSILSRKWRYSWMTIPKLVFDTDLVKLSGISQLDKYKFVNAIFHVLLLHTAPIVEFALFVNEKIGSEVDQIILHLSRSNNNIKKLMMCTWGIRGTNRYMIPSSIFSLQGLERLRLQYCAFELPSMNKGFTSLKILRFAEVSITNKMLFKFLTNCPLLEEFTWIRGDLELSESELIEMFKCLPLVQFLHISRFYIKHLAAGGMPHKLPISPSNLRRLVLRVCFLELSSVVSVISSSPNLEKIDIRLCWDHDEQCVPQTFNLIDDKDYRGLNLDHLKEMEIDDFHNYALEMEFVKLIMAKSPVLKKARIVVTSFHVSVDEQEKMLQDFLHIPFQRASPASKFTIERLKSFHVNAYKVLVMPV